MFDGAAIILEERIASLSASFREWDLPEFQPPFLLLESGVSVLFFPQLKQLKNLGRIPDESEGWSEPVSRKSVSVHWLLYGSLTCVTAELWRLWGTLMLRGCCSWKAELIPWRTCGPSTGYGWCIVKLLHVTVTSRWRSLGTKAVGGVLAQPPG